MGDSPQGNLWKDQEYSCQAASSFIVPTESRSYLVLCQRQDGVENAIAYARRGIRSLDRKLPAHK